MKVRSAAAAIVIIVGTVTLVSSPARAQTPATACEVGAPLVDVTYRFANEQDFNSSGYVWALDTGIARFRLYRTGVGTFCAAITSAGTFTTFAGPSPAGTGTVPAGFTGRFAGQMSLHFVGSFAPKLPTRGFVGSFDARCDQLDCETPIQFGRNYVDVAGPPTPGPFRAVYVSGCGVWVQTSDGELGDIAC